MVWPLVIACQRPGQCCVAVETAVGRTDGCQTLVQVLTKLQILLESVACSAFPKVFNSMLNFQRSSNDKCHADLELKGGHDVERNDELVTHYKIKIDNAMHLQ